MVTRAFLVGLILSLGLSACSATQLRVGPLGIGVASHPDGTIEGAISGPDGTVLAANSTKLNLPGIVAQGWSWLAKILPTAALSMLSTAPTPTGPVPAAVPTPSG